MGISSLSLSLLMAATSLPVEPVPSQAAQAPMESLQAAPIPERTYRQRLLEGDLEQLHALCLDADRFGLSQRMQELRDRLMVVAPAPQSFPVVMANTRALMACRAPDSARQVLNRYGPGIGARRRDWLMLSWEAAAAAKDHDAAVLALRRLAHGDLTRLSAVRLPMALSDTGLPITRSALDQLAEHEAAAGRLDRAAAVALSGGGSGGELAARLGRAVVWLEALGQTEVSDVLETALDQAALDQAWGLAEELLRIQLRLERRAGGDGARPQQRLQRLASRLDDRYTLWELIRDGAAPLNPQDRRAVLEGQLRSPRQPSGATSLGESTQQGLDGPVSPANP